MYVAKNSFLISFWITCAISNEQDERFHQNVKTIEKHHQEYWNENMLSDYCWTIILKLIEVT